MKPPKDHEDIIIVPTDFVRIEQNYSNFDTMDEFENFTLEMYDFIIEEFPNAYFAKGELYPESIGCDIRYVKGETTELTEILKSIQNKFGIDSLQIETDLFETKQDEILEAAANRSIDLDYDTDLYFVHVRQIIQHVHFSRGMEYADLRSQTETFDSTIIHTGLSLRSEHPGRFVPPFLYSEIRTDHIEA